MDKVTVEHSKEEQLIIYLRKGFFESNSKFEYRVQKALFWRDNDYYTEIRVYPNSVVIVHTLKKEIDIKETKLVLNKWKLVKQKEARLRLEKPKRPLKFLQFYVGRDKNRKQHVGGCKGKNRVSDRRAYYRKFIKPAINKIAA